jgi:hypothetical protein
MTKRERMFCVNSKTSDIMYLTDLWGVARWCTNSTARNLNGRYSLVWMPHVLDCALFAGLEQPRHKACVVNDYGTLVPVADFEY